MKRLALIAAAFSMSAAALATPETYVIDGGHTFPRFEYNHLGYSLQSSRFDKTSGKITLDRAAKTGSVEVNIDAKSVNTGYSVFNGHLQGEDYFNTEKFPTITFVSTGVKFDGDKVTAVDGNLTMKGVTKPVTLTVTSFHCMAHPMNKKDTCGANATAKIKRSDFNMGKNAPYVSDEVTLSIPVEASKQ